MITKVYHLLVSMLSCGTGMRDIRPHDERSLGEVGGGGDDALGSWRRGLWRGGAAIGGGVALYGLLVEVWPAVALGGVPSPVGFSAVVWPSCSVVRFYAAILPWPRRAGVQLARPSLRAALFVKVESLC